MPRRDRIAPLPAPPRDRTFAAWPVLRDLDGEPPGGELEHRVRVRFLALRVARRFIDVGPGSPPVDSFARQIDTVEAELAVLPADDAERQRLARFLAAARRLSARSLAAAALDVADAALRRGHVHAGEEYRRIAAELAAVSGAEREHDRAGHALAGSAPW